MFILIWVNMRLVITSIKLIFRWGKGRDMVYMPTSDWFAQSVPTFSPIRGKFVYHNWGEYTMGRGMKDMSLDSKLFGCSMLIYD